MSYNMVVSFIFRTFARDKSMSAYRLDVEIGSFYNAH